jgi:excisionase family DNA binding protein
MHRRTVEHTDVNASTQNAEFLDKQGVAALLSVSKRTVDSMLARGELPVVRLSKRLVRFPRQAVLESINRRVVCKF